MIFEHVKTHQLSMLTACCLVCILQAIYILVIKGQSIKRRRSMFLLEMSVAVLMLADAYAYNFQGKTTSIAYFGVRIATFLVYLSTPGIILLFNLFITYFIMETGRFEKLPKQLLYGFIVQSVSLTLVIISQFTHWYYYFDTSNYYHRGPLFLISFLSPYIGMILQLSFLITYRKIISKDMFFAVVIFSIVPMVIGVFQVLQYGFSFLNFAIWTSADVLFVMVLTDQNKKLVKAADTEVFTGLPNTTGYISAVDNIIAYKDITLYNGYYFDIVRMSQINDKFGKKTGDEIICLYAEYIRRHIDSDEILGRLGGNFFVALIKRTNNEKFLEMLSDVPVKVPNSKRSETVHIAAVAGIYEIKNKHIVGGQVISNCATALAYAKNDAHKPYVYLDSELEEYIKNTRAIEEQTRIALEKEEFEPYYQPKVDSSGNKLFGAEALVRWRHDGRIIAPIEFISIMEKNRSICDLDFYMLDKVCQDIKGWLDDGLNPVTISINFSRRNLGNSDFASRINEIVCQYSIPKELVQIEITETIDDYPMEVLVDFIKQLHEYGFSAAIDDFGIGSSSINLLKSVSFDVLKIDKTFVNFKNTVDRLVLEHIIGIASDIGLITVAEGVETKDQIEALGQMGCTLIQGYIYSKPIIKSEFEKRLVNPYFKI